MSSIKLPSWVNLRVGLLLGLLTAVAVGIGTTQTWRVLDVESAAFVQQSIGDSAKLFASHVADVADQYRLRTAEIGSLALRGENEAATTLLARDSEQIRLSVWQKGPEGLIRRAEVDNPKLASDGTAIPGISEDVEREFVVEGFEGRMRLRGLLTGSEIRSVMIAEPLPAPDQEHALLALSQFTLERVRKTFTLESIIAGQLVDETGLLLAGFGNAPSSADAMLFKQMKGGALSSGQKLYRDDRGTEYFGGYYRVEPSGLGVLIRVPAQDVRAGLSFARKQSLGFILVTFLLFSALGTFYARKSGAAVPEKSPDSRLTSTDQGVAATPPVRAPAFVLHGAIRGLDEMTESLGAEAAIESLNEVLTLIESRSRAWGGTYHYSAGQNFVLSWRELPDPEAWKVVRCALEIRRDLRALNEARRVDGQKPLLVGMGVHAGVALYGKIGPSGRSSEMLAGNLPAEANALTRQSMVTGHDLLVTQGAWNAVQGSVIGGKAGEAVLTELSGLVELYFVDGYREADGQEVKVESPYARTEAAAIPAVNPVSGPKRWFINNGSQILGPLLPAEIAPLLFAQELDFDCECWAEGTGDSAQLRSSGVFGGSDGEDAKYWVFDGQTIHGPLSKGFLMTAIQHGAVSRASYICEDSTTKGWKSVPEWLGEPAEPALELPVLEEPPRETPPVTPPGKPDSEGPSGSSS